MKNSNKLLSLFLAIILIVSAFPIITYGEENELINTIYLIADTDAFTYYHVGQEERTVTNQLINNVLSIDTNYKYAYYLDKNNSGLGVYENETYRNDRNGNLITAEKDYKYIFEIQAESGYDFDTNSENITVYLNGNLVEPENVFYNEYWDSYRLYLDIDYAPAAQPVSIPIEYVYFDNMEKIRAGSPSPSTTTNNYESLFQISDYSWSCKEDLEFSTGDIFKGSSTYTLSITLTPNSGYEFLTDPETGKFIGKISSYSNYDSYSYKMNDNKLVIDYLYTTEEILNNIYINIDYNSWNKFKSGLNATEAEDQLLDAIASIPSKYETKYYINKSNSRLLKFSDGAPRNIEADELISNDLTYYINFSIWSENSVSFDPNSENITVYINGIKVTPYNLFYNSYWDLYEVTIELDKFFEASITADKISAIKGDSVTITANATGGSGNYTYKYAILNVDTNKWSILKDFTSENTLTYKLNYPGKKQFAVTVKDSSGKTISTNRVDVNVAEPLAASLKSNGSTNAVTKQTGSKIKLDATAIGGSGDYTYKFAVLNVDNGKWSMLKDFSKENTLTYALNYPGKKQFAVTVKDSTGKTVATNRIDVTVANNVVTPSVTLSVDSSSDALNKSVGDTIKLEANASNFTGECTYKFVVHNIDTNTWYTLKDYGKDSSYSVKLSSAGNKEFVVSVKDSKGTIVASNRLVVTAAKATPLTVNLTANGSSESINAKVGDSINLVATTNGGTSPYTYKFAVYNVDYNSWYILKDYSESSSFNVKLSSAGKKEFVVSVKDSKGTIVSSKRILVTSTN